MRKILLFVLFSMSFSCYSSNPNTENGLLWKISGNDLKFPSYLFGTYHGNGINGDFVESIPKFKNIFESVNQYVGESDFALLNSIEMQAFYREWLGEIQMPEGTNYKALLNEKDYEYLDSLVRFHLRMFIDRSNIAPNYLSLWLIQMRMEDHMQSVFNRRKAIVIDEYLRNLAYKKAYTIKGLDSPQVRFKYMKLQYGSIPFPNSSFKESVDTLISISRKFDKMLSVKFPREIIDCAILMENAYKNQNIKNLIKYNSKLFELNKNYQHKFKELSFIEDNNEVELNSLIVLERNLLWMEKIPKYINEKPTFIGVGAMHLFGETGLINLLRKEGYVVSVVK